jgi:hypothetical protein
MCLLGLKIDADQKSTHKRKRHKNISPKKYKKTNCCAQPHSHAVERTCMRSSAPVCGRAHLYAVKRITLRRSALKSALERYGRKVWRRMLV